MSVDREIKIARAGKLNPSLLRRVICLKGGRENRLRWSIFRHDPVSNPRKLEESRVCISPAKRDMTVIESRATSGWPNLIVDMRRGPVLETTTIPVLLLTLHVSSDRRWVILPPGWVI